MSIMKFTAMQLSKEISTGKISIREAVQESISQIEILDKEYNCFITVAQKEDLFKRADVIQKQIDAKVLTNALAGVPIAIKDNICTKNMLTTCASKMLHNFIPTYSAKVTENLEASGALIIGKTNMDEFAMGSTSETSAYGIVKNPKNTLYVPGGSSGGSAAAVAANECICALGSDTGGSIRQPSAFCGVTGIKPTYGTVSRYGLVAYASSMDQIGPIAKDVADCAYILETIALYDDKDSTSMLRKEYNFTKALISDVRGMKIGIPKEYFNENVDAEVKNAVLEAVKALEGKGAIVSEFSLEMTKYAVETYYIIASAEASSNLARFDGVKYGYRNEEANNLSQMYKKTRTEGFGKEVKRRIMLGSFVLSSGFYDEYYLKAQKSKRLIKNEFDKAFDEYDVIIAPTSPTTAFKIGESISNPIKMYQSDVCTVAANLIGLPAISLPCGVDSKNLPIGMQIIGNCFREDNIIRAAYTYEQLRKE